MVLPVYNGVSFLGEAIDSLLAQTETNFQLIAVDDGSTDGTAEMLSVYAARDARVQPAYCEHLGIVAALNHGLELAQAPYIARMDADDLCHPERLRLQADFLDAHTDIGLVSCHAEYGGDGEVHGGFAAFVNWTNSLVTQTQIALNCFIESPLIHPTVTFRSHLSGAFGNYRQGPFPEDYELWLRWLDAGVKMAKLARPLVTWRERPERLSRQDERYGEEGFYFIKTKYLLRYLERSAQGRALVVWGAGKAARRRAALLEAGGATIVAYIDVDPRKIGNKLAGIPVLSPAQLPAVGDCFLLSYVANRGARAEIESYLWQHGYEAGRDYLLAG